MKKRVSKNSIESYRELYNNGKVQTIDHMVFKHLISNPKQSSRIISVQLDIDRCTVTGALNRLTNKECITAENNQCSVTGRTVKFYSVNQEKINVSIIKK